MKVAIYPGSFNPLHKGHIDVIEKAFKVFDCVVVARGCNPDKKAVNYYMDVEESNKFDRELIDKLPMAINQNNIKGFVFKGLLRDFIDEGYMLNRFSAKPCAIIKGLRNGRDLDYEKDQQYWNEDLGIEIPFFYIIADRNLAHISSSAIRGLEKFGADV